MDNWSQWRKGRAFDVRYYIPEAGKTFPCKVEIYGRQSGRITSRNGAGKRAGRKNIIWVTWRGLRMTLEQICQL